MRKVIAKDKQPKKVRVKKIMTPRRKLVTAGRFDDVHSIAQKMAKHDKTRIPILEEGKLVGIVTNKDVLSNSREHMSILLEQARLKGPDDRGAAYPLAHGKCEICGSKGNLNFKENKFLCELCL